MDVRVWGGGVAESVETHVHATCYFERVCVCKRPASMQTEKKQTHKTV